MRAGLRRAVVIALVAIWCGPAAALAQPVSAAPAINLGTPKGFRTSRDGLGRAELALPHATNVGTRKGLRTSRDWANLAETTQLAAREREAQDLADWRGGEGVYFVIGSGLMLVLVVVLVLVLV